MTQEKIKGYRAHLHFFLTHRECFFCDISAAAAVIHKLGGMAGEW